MSAKRNSGPAFPVPYRPDGAPGYASGMTLRDWFAGQVLASYVAAVEPDIAAEWSYRFADAMLAERERAAHESEAT